MSRRSTEDQKHKESRDISPAYVLYLGDFKGARLQCFSPDGGKLLAEFAEPYRMGLFDPRLPHGVVRDRNFKGNRYCMVFFKMWDELSKNVRPLELQPRYLEDAQVFHNMPSREKMIVNHPLRLKLRIPKQYITSELVSESVFHFVPHFI